MKAKFKKEQLERFDDYDDIRGDLLTKDVIAEQDKRAALVANFLHQMQEEVTRYSVSRLMSVTPFHFACQ